MTLLELARDFALEMIRKSGVREWTDSDTRTAISQAAVEMALAIFGEGFMAVSAVFRKQFGTAKTLKPSGGTGAMTPSTLANGSYWQSAKIDLNATQGRWWLDLAVDLAATPTAGNLITFWWNPSSSGTAGTDNKGGCSGADAAYSGYSSNAAASVPQLTFIGSVVCTTQTSLQKAMVQGILDAPNRYGSLVMLNGSGAAFASDTNFVVTLTPEEGTSEPS